MMNDLIQPLVSIVLPLYNAEQYIVQTLSSIINQTYKNWELIIIDDCSNDHSISVIEEIVNKDSRIHLYHNERNLGVTRTRNKGFTLCNGEYVALIDSDDLWEEHKLELQVEAANKNNADIIYCSYSIIDTNNKKISNDFIVPKTISYKRALIQSVMSCSTTMLKKEIVEKYQFSTDYYHEDLVYWLQILKEGYKAIGVQDVLASYRIVNNSRSSNKWIVIKNRYRVYRDFCKYSIVYSYYLIFQYGILALKKYKTKKK